MSMALNRSKINSPIEKKLCRSATANSLSTNNSYISQQKSLIPTFRSNSQPPGTFKFNSRQFLVDISKNQTVESNLVEQISNENNEAGEEVLTIQSNTDETDFDTVSTIISTICDEPKDDLTIITKADAFNQTTEVYQIVTNSKSMSSNEESKSLLRKNSLSAIPVSKNSTASNQNKYSYKSSSRSSTPRKSLTNSSFPNSYVTSKKALEMKFLAKKTRYDTLKKEMIDRQKAVLSLYHDLTELKKKIEPNGKSVTLEVPQIIEFEQKNLKAAGEQLNDDNDNVIQPHILITIKSIFVLYIQLDKTINNESKTIAAECDEIIKMFNHLNKDDIYLRDIKKKLEQFKENELAFFSNFQKTIGQKNKTIKDVIEKIDMSINSKHGETMKSLESKLQDQEVVIKDLNLELEKARNQLKQKDAAISEEMNNAKTKTSALEKALEIEKQNCMVEKEKYKQYKNNEKFLRSTIKAYKIEKLQTEDKFKELCEELKVSEAKIKSCRDQSDKITELRKDIQVGKKLVEELNKDKISVECKLQEVSDALNALQAKKDAMESDLLQQINEAKNDADMSRNCIMDLKMELELMHKQLNDMELQSEENAFETNRERECTFQFEIATLQNTIRNLQDKIEENAGEKLKLIETINTFTEDSENLKESFLSSLEKKDENINILEANLKVKEDEISNLMIEIENLRIDKQSLTAKIQSIKSMKTIDGNEEVKLILKEGKTKLEQALLQSMENEHKIMKYEHELAQKNQIIINLKNLMKIRDGLLGMMKAKKDELCMENLSLTKYSEEIRNCVLESKQEMKLYAEQIANLRVNLEKKCKALYEEQHHSKELEERLSAANEKRYKLQDTVGIMEKELQTIKAQHHQQSSSTHNETSEVIDKNMKVCQASLKPWTNTGNRIFNHYRTAYQREQLLKTFGLQRPEDHAQTKNLSELRQEAVRDNSGKVSDEIKHCYNH